MFIQGTRQPPQRREHGAGPRPPGGSEQGGQGAGCGGRVIGIIEEAAHEEDISGISSNGDSRDSGDTASQSAELDLVNANYQEEQQVHFTSKCIIQDFIHSYIFDAINKLFRSTTSVERG